MRQRIITVPKNKMAEEALDYDNATKEQLIEFSLNELEFSFLHQEGIIDLINENGNANIDDFEDDSVRGKENLQRVVLALNLKKSSLNHSHDLISNLIDLFVEAQDRDTGVYFYF